MIKRRLQVILVENGTSIKIGEGELGVRVDSEERFGTVVRLFKGRIGEPNSGFFNLDLDLSEKTIMAFRNAIEEAPEDPLGHLLDASGSQVDSMPAQPITIMALSDSVTHERTMLIEIYPNLWEAPSEELLESFERCMLGHKVLTGLFITPNHVFVIRDPVTSRDFEPGTFHRNTINTERLLENIAGWNLESRVRSWLQSISSGYWSGHIPKESYPFMIPFVVGNLKDAVFQDWEVADHNKVAGC